MLARKDSVPQHRLLVRQKLYSKHWALPGIKGTCRFTFRYCFLPLVSAEDLGDRCMLFVAKSSALLFGLVNGGSDAGLAVNREGVQ